jgi:hypothetical protein
MRTARHTQLSGVETTGGRESGRVVWVRDKLGGLVVGEPEGGEVFVAEGDLAEVLHQLQHVLLHDTQPVPQLNQICTLATPASVHAQAVCDGACVCVCVCIPVLSVT